MNQFLPFVLGSAISIGAVALGVAGELPDPTRPPASIRPASTSGGPAVAAAPVLVLQSVLTGEGRKPTAIINGRVLELGDSFDGQKLVRIFDTGALLAGPGGPTTLALTPSSEKVAVVAQPQPLVVATSKPARRVESLTYKFPAEELK